MHRHDRKKYGRPVPRHRSSANIEALSRISADRLTLGVKCKADMSARVHRLLYSNKRAILDGVGLRKQSRPLMPKSRSKRVLTDQLTLDDGQAQRAKEVRRVAGGELVIALVGAVGTDTASISNMLADELSVFGYRSEVIHLIELLHQIDRWNALPEEPANERYRTHMDAGNEFREIVRRRDAMISLGIAYIRRLREKLTGDGNKPSARTAYILRSVKKPAEINTLRRIYGTSVVVIGAYSPEPSRVRDLAKKIAATSGGRAEEFDLPARELVKRDQEETDNRFGQNVRSAFPLADFFVNADNADEARRAVQRVLQLLFGTSFHTPTKDEQGMFFAHAAGARSASLGRQVGAAICDDDGAVIAIGCNEVPKFGGGSYWTGDAGDKRDHLLGVDSNDSMKRQLLQDVLARLKAEGWLHPTKAELSEPELLKKAAAVPNLANAKLMDILEYGRAVHAEMAALSDAVRHGFPVKGCTLYTTTFPCHNCAKHVVAAGIARLVYIAPYPKSFVADLFSDSITVDSAEETITKLQFQSFVGVSPRKYLDLFSMGNLPRKIDGRVVIPEKMRVLPRNLLPAHAYLISEQQQISDLNGRLKHTELTIVTEPELTKHE
jgi:deoxycytidylate deaminase